LTTLPDPFEIVRPDHVAAPVVFNSPHSGARYPIEFLAETRLDPLTLRRSEDAFVDDLFIGAVGRGAPLMRAHFPRAFLDVNREPYELDPRMFEGRLPAFVNTRSLRVAGGLGTIARIVGEAQEIYSRRLPVAEAFDRIETLYKPYHDALTELLADTRNRFGSAVLVDCHSMPSSGTPRDGQRADIVLGDRYGTSCDPVLSDLAEASLKALGFSVARNRPYAGGYITEHYGTPMAGTHALQVEINRGLYMDERRHEKTPAFADVQALITQFCDDLIGFVEAALEPHRAAAE
jgi:N-formylglutamate amidohydrolase